MLSFAHFFYILLNLLFTFPNIIFSNSRCWPFSLLSQNLINICIPFPPFYLSISLLNHGIHPINLSSIIFLCAMLIMSWSWSCLCVLLYLFQVASSFCDVIFIFFSFLRARCIFSIANLL